jgi:aminodeoxyfutalosine synthase
MTPAGREDPALRPVAEKVEGAERLSRADGLALFRSSDLLTIGRLADLANQRTNGDRVSFAANQHLNPTNVCVLRNTCVFCSFARMPQEDGAYVARSTRCSPKRTPRDNPTREFHIVGGLHQTQAVVLPGPVSRPEAAPPHRALKALTAVEVAHLAKLERLSIREVLVAMREAG